MSTPPFDPANYEVQVFALGQAGPLASDGWYNWADSTQPITASFVSGLAVKSLWFPHPLGPMSFYAGADTSGTPFYVSAGAVAELVSIPNDAPQVTISGPGGQIYFYASSFPYTPFAAGTPADLDIEVVAPIVNTGTPSAPIIGLATPLAVVYGGSGSTDPSLIAGANVTITGSWPNQQIDVSEGAGGVQTVAVQAPIILTGTAQNPIIGLDTPLAINYGGSGTADPYLEGTDGITVNGADSTEDQTFQWVLALTAFLLDNAGATINGPGQLLAANGITVTKTNPKEITLDTKALIPVTGGLTSVDSSVTITPHAGSQTVDLSVSGGTFSKEMDLVGSTPSATLSLTGIPAGTWLFEAYVIGLDCPALTTGTATLTMSTGDVAGFDNTQFTRYLGIASKNTLGSPGSVSATLGSTGGVNVNPHFSTGFFLLKATPIAP